MMTIEPTIQTPLVVTDDDTIRIKGTRVTLDLIVRAFLLGATAEEIAHKFPSTSLEAIYSTISYYLTHRAEIDEYLCQRATAAAEIYRHLEAQPGVSEFRAKLLARRLSKS